MKRFARNLSPLSLCGGAALLLSAAGWSLDRPMFFASWLAAWWFCLGVVLGAAANSAMHALTGGRWGEVLLPWNAALGRSLPGLLVLFLPMLAGIGTIYPWSAAPQALAASLAHPRFEQAWFAPEFFAARLAVYAVAWWLIARRPTRSKGHAAAALAGYMFLTSLAAVDLVMSLVPGWTSSVFGWLALCGQMTAGFGVATWLAASRQEAPHEPVPAGHVPVWRDLGNLLLMDVMLQAYLQFMQFLIIWAENLPSEISWYLPRLDTGWWMVGLALVLLQFAAPTLLLLWRSVKDAPARLARVAMLIVVMQGVDAAWLVVPSVQPHGYSAWWLLPLTFCGMTLLLFGDLLPMPRAVASRSRNLERIAHERS
jgi:hypothetical protein